MCARDKKHDPAIGGGNLDDKVAPTAGEYSINYFAVKDVGRLFKPAPSSPDRNFVS